MLGNVVFFCFDLAKRIYLIPIRSQNYHFLFIALGGIKFTCTSQAFLMLLALIKNLCNPDRNPFHPAFSDLLHPVRPFNFLISPFGIQCIAYYITQGGYREDEMHGNGEKESIS